MTGVVVDPHNPDAPAREAATAAEALAMASAPSAAPPSFEPPWDEQALASGGFEAIQARTQAVAAGFGQLVPHGSGGGQQSQHGQSQHAPAFGGGPFAQQRGGTFDAREASRTFKPKTYSDLCMVALDRFSAQAWRIRVVRTRPTDPRFKGNLGDYERMSDEEFGAYFGGGSYEATLLVERAAASGELVVRPEASATFDYPGMPMAVAIRQPDLPATDPNRGGGNGYHPQNGVQNGYGYAGPNQKVEEIRAKHEVDMQTMLLSRALESNGGRDQTQMMQSFSEKVLTQQNEAAARAIESLQRSLEQKDQEIARINKQKEEEVARAQAETRAARSELSTTENECRRRLLESDALLVTKVREARTEADAAAEVKYESRIQSREHELRLERENKDRQIEAERTMTQRRLSEIEASKTAEIIALRGEHERGMQAERSDRQREVTGLTSMYEQRLLSATRENVRDQGSASDTTKMLLAMKDSELSSVRSDNAALKEENTSLKAQVFKPLMAQVKEIATLAPLLGYTQAGDAEPAEAAPAPEPPKSIAEKLIDAAPGMMKAFGPMLGPAVLSAMGGMGGGMGGGGGQPQPQQAPPPRQMQAPPPMQPPPQAPPQQRPRQMATTLGGTTPLAMGPTLAPPRKPAVAAPPPLPPEQGGEKPRYEEIVGPARFRVRGPQPASPDEISALLKLLTEQGKEALATGANAAQKASELRGMFPELIGQYVAWVDATNALVLLEREEPFFWGGEDAREWFTAFWEALGPGVAAG